MASLTILGIESSCDETSASIVRNEQVLSNIIFTQTIHEEYGGVVPESASRLHIRHIVPVVDDAFRTARLTPADIDAVAYTQSPGLIGSLLVGAGFAKAFAQARGIPTLAVNHMQAHVFANLIEHPTMPYPFLCLTVSGGHTQLVMVKAPLETEILGETIDDAAGEAFDKAAKMLGLPYPGGPLIDRYAQQGDPKRFEFAKPNILNLDFSFSGLKTSILYFLQKQQAINPAFIDENRNDLCASIQSTVVTILLKKLTAAVKQTGIKHIALAGGVSANSGLRRELTALAAQRRWSVYI
ncbi:MAG: tRNA (adenosine(37)-N6)-threonylcarbamoyltransferase complex transferase subunit TsaD, partial [Chitinophagaceae bacterium]|nr:tRNA (adenosine(37)-N6)-threonylcarbamoyltransferase complex transferase subunit TsaD [Chitinophagaceae bacterium]